MLGKKFLEKVLNLLALTLAIFLMVSPNAAEAKYYYFGIVGIESRVKDSDINLGDYTNLNSPELAKTPLEYAQGTFERVLTDELPKIELSEIGAEFKSIDKTEETTSARIKELNFQLEHGNPKEAVKLFDQKLDYLIYGYIANLTITHRESIATSNVNVRVDLTTRIVDANTGKVVCVAVGKGESASHGGGNRKTFEFGGKEVSVVSWHEALEKALNQIVDKIKKQV